jgi:predicted DNA-binding transcriptional regulator YafY
VRASRLLSILLLLQTRGRLSARELADELEVSVRTVYRDVEALSAAGVPVYADRGASGGYQLLDGYRTKLTGLTADEAEALFLAGLPSHAAQLGLGTVLAAAQLKLKAALPPELRDRAERLQERFHLDAPGWFREPVSPVHLETVANAVWHQRALRIGYERWDASEVERTIEPLGLVLKGTNWYVVARGRSQVNAYRVDRIHAVEVLDDTFERPSGFDLAAYWAEWARRLEATLYRGTAVVRLSPRAVELFGLSGPVATRALRESSSEPDRDGWVRVTLPIESTEHATRELLRYGADAEVLEPAEVRDRIAAHLAGMRKLYG